MNSLSRRSFLGASLTGFASPPLFGADTTPAKDTGLPNTLFLTWQRDPTTTMTIQWIAPAAEAASMAVQCWPAGFVSTLLATPQAKAPKINPYPLCDLKLFRVEVTDLKPNTDYLFRIGKNPATGRFRTMPAKATNTIHFISGGDCGVNPHTIANNIQGARQDPMFALIGGDLAYDNGKSLDTNLGFIRNYSKHMVGRDGRLIPMVTCIGNHEVDGGYSKPRAKAPFFYALFDGLFPDTGFATLDFGDYLSLVLLDTNHTTPIGGDQANWLEKMLKERIDHPNVFVVNHVPAYPSYRNPEGAKGKEGTGDGNRKHWVPLFQKYRVPVVLEHHDHTFKRTKPLIDGLAASNGVLYLGDGSWGKLRNPKDPDKISYLESSSRDYHLSLHRIQGEERFHMALDENGRVMDVCRSGQRKKGLVSVPGSE